LSLRQPLDPREARETRVSDEQRFSGAVRLEKIEAARRFCESLGVSAVLGGEDESLELSCPDGKGTLKLYRGVVTGPESFSVPLSMPLYVKDGKVKAALRHLQRYKKETVFLHVTPRKKLWDAVISLTDRNRDAAPDLHALFRQGLVPEDGFRTRAGKVLSRMVSGDFFNSGSTGAESTLAASLNREYLKMEAPDRPVPMNSGIQDVVRGILADKNFVSVLRGSVDAMEAAGMGVQQVKGKLYISFLPDSPLVLSPEKMADLLSCGGVKDSKGSGESGEQSRGHYGSFCCFLAL